VLARDVKKGAVFLSEQTQLPGVRATALMALAAFDQPA
jgi:hypothetical protein